MSVTNLHDQLKRDEGVKLTPYRCTAGKLTIGVGRNLDDMGITEKEADIMLANDIYRCGVELVDCGVNAWISHSFDSPHHPAELKIRHAALLNMLFNLGMTRFMQFKNMIAAWNDGDFDKCADEMLDSKWARQVGDRAQRLAKQMRTGEWQ